jgi:hypothetical protein
MHHPDFDNDQAQLNPFLYWATWISLFLGSKAIGFFGFVANEIVVPKHEIRYLPQLEELLPAVIVAGCCAIVSALLGKTVNMIWNKFSPKKK